MIYIQLNISNNDYYRMSLNVCSIYHGVYFQCVHVAKQHGQGNTGANFACAINT